MAGDQLVLEREQQSFGLTASCQQKEACAEARAEGGKGGSHCARATRATRASRRGKVSLVRLCLKRRAPGQTVAPVAGQDPAGAGRCNGDRKSAPARQGTRMRTASMPLTWSTVVGALRAMRAR